MVYDFYTNNLRDFAKYEPIDIKAAKTLVYYEKLLEVEQEMFLAKEAIRFYLFEKYNPFQIVGTVSFREISFAPYRLSAKIGYKIDHRFRRRGYATEAITAACHAMFVEEKLHRIEATVLPDNTASQRLLEGLGFAFEGRLRDEIRLNGQWRDHLVYGLLNPYD